jgi:glyceraldehyde-3-phosphate dehydrogenase (NAD(P))
VHLADGRLYYFQAVHQEADVVPENVDCIRAMLGLTDDPWKSIEMTDRTLEIGGT